MAYALPSVVQGLNYLADNPQILIGICVAYVLVYAISVFWGSSKSGPNPFSYDSTRTPGPLEIEQKVRDKVLKQGFVAKKVPEDLDAIVIGSGIGGLTTASLLSRVGKKVLVLEQHDQAGGCCHTYIEKGFEFDVGIHYIGEVGNNTVTKSLIDQLTDGQLQWEPLDKQFDTVVLKGKKYPLLSGRDDFRKCLIGHFPNEQKGIDKFLKFMKDVRRSTLGLIMVKFLPKWIVKFLILTGLINLATSYFKLASKSVTSFLKECTDDADLRAVLSYSFGDYGTIPKDSSAAMQAMLLNHFKHGSFYPRGGASEIAYHIIPTIEQSGGRVLVRAPVINILEDGNGKVNGVRVHKSSGDLDIYAPIVISNAGLLNTLRMVPKPLAEKSSMAPLIGKVKNGMGALTLFVGLKGTKEELGLKAHNIWSFQSNKLDEDCEEYFSLSAEEVRHTDPPLLFISFPSAKDPTIEDRFPGKSTCTVVTLGNWEWFSEWEEGKVMHRGKDYEDLKKDIADRMWSKTVALFPQLEGKVEYMELGTPITNKYYIGADKGEIYGLDHNLERLKPEIQMQLRPATGIKGLYLTGQDIFLCGFSGAMFGGLLCACKVLNRNLYLDLMKLKKDMAKLK